MDNELAIIKASSETAKNFSDIMKNFLQPDSIDLAIAEGHKELKMS